MDNYTIELTDEQWDMVVLSLGYILERAQPAPPSHSPNPIDVLGRRVLRRRVNAIIAQIQDVYAEAGSEDFDA